MTVLIGRLASVTEGDEREQVRELAEQLENVGMIDASLLDGNADLIESSCDCHNSTHESNESKNTVSVNIDPTTPGKMLEDAATQAAAEDSDDAPNSGTLAEYREQQTNAAEDGDTEDVDGTPSTFAEWRQAVGEDVPKRKHLSFAELLRGGRNE